MSWNNRKSNKESSSLLNWCRGPASGGRPASLTFGLVWIALAGISLTQWALPAHAEFFSTRSVKFMEGEWISHDKEKDEIAQEIWSSAQGDSMAGVCRHIQGEDTTLLELMTLKEKNGGLYLQIKHFDGNLKPWAEDKESGECKMVSGEHFKNAVFESVSKKNNLRITYELKGGELVATVEVIKKGETKKFVFEYRREKLHSQMPTHLKFQTGDFDSHMRKEKQRTIYKIGPEIRKISPDDN